MFPRRTLRSKLTQPSPGSTAVADTACLDPLPVYRQAQEQGLGKRRTNLACSRGSTMLLASGLMLIGAGHCAGEFVCRSYAVRSHLSSDQHAMMGPCATCDPLDDDSTCDGPPSTRNSWRNHASPYPLRLSHLVKAEEAAPPNPHMMHGLNQASQRLPPGSHFRLRMISKWHIKR